MLISPCIDWSIVLVGHRLHGIREFRSYCFTLPDSLSFRSQFWGTLIIEFVQSRSSRFGWCRINERAYGRLSLRFALSRSIVVGYL